MTSELAARYPIGRGMLGPSAKQFLPSVCRASKVPPSTYFCLLVLYNAYFAESSLAYGSQQVEVVQIDGPIKVNDLCRVEQSMSVYCNVQYDLQSYVTGRRSAAARHARQSFHCRRRRPPVLTRTHLGFAARANGTHI